MLFFGDRDRSVDPRAEAAGIGEGIRAVAALPPGPDRHAALAGLLVRAGGLAQGVADAERARSRADETGAGERAAMAATLALARALWASWRRGGRGPDPDPVPVRRLLRARLPDEIRIRRAEGFALYAVYPEAYAAAARALAGQAPTVIGIRSIGTALAAMVSAGAGVREPPATVRPVGDPFRREVRLGPALAATLAARPGPFAIADEGPGLSGSSFAAVARALVALGAGEERIHVFPSHAGPPGPEAGAEAAALHARLARHHVPFEALFLGDGPLALARLAQDAVGEAEAAPEDLSAGEWRRLLFGKSEGWPPSSGWRERRKYLLRAGGRTWWARFAGLGVAGERTLSRARALAAAGLVPTPAALRHGFLFERFEEGAVPLPRARVARPRLLEAVRRHLRFVAHAFPAARDDGASPRALAEMARTNARLALGPGAEADVARLAHGLAELERSARPVAVDGKLQRWEWLVRADGTIVKADALDHHADHGLAGCQDALWDVAGAAVELRLSEDEARALGRAVRDACPGAPLRWLPFYRAAYAAFEVGRWTLASQDAGLEDAERRRRAREAERMRGALRDALALGAMPAVTSRATSADTPR
jgi:hypothetical protein